MEMWFLFFFCKQKTAYEMRISDWSSDVCSSDLTHSAGGGFGVPELPDLSSTLPTIINNPLVYVESLVFSNAGFDSDNFHAIVNGIVEAIRRAHANLEAHSQSGSIRMSEIGRAHV